MQLFLMRHANTEASGHKEDLQREITEIGKKEALEAASFLKNYRIDKILVSYVKRAIQTSNIILEQVQVHENQMVTELYGENEEEAIKLILSQQPKNKHILILGHNPLIYKIALFFATPDSEKYEHLVDSAMPTGRIIVIDFKGIDEWEQTKTTKGKIIEIFTPSVA